MIATALESLRPGAAWSLNDGDLTWLDEFQTEPTETEIAVEITRLETLVIPKMIKGEAARRIGEKLKDEVTQRNMTALATSLGRKERLGTIDPWGIATLDLLDAAFDWVQSMQDKGRDLAAAQDADYELDSKWPAPPVGLAALVAEL